MRDEDSGSGDSTTLNDLATRIRATKSFEELVGLMADELSASERLRKAAERVLSVYDGRRHPDEDPEEEPYSGWDNWHAALDNLRDALAKGNRKKPTEWKKPMERYPENEKLRL